MKALLALPGGTLKCFCHWTTSSMLHWLHVWMCHHLISPQCLACGPWHMAEGNKVHKGAQSGVPCPHFYLQDYITAHCGSLEERGWCGTCRLVDEDIGWSWLGLRDDCGWIHLYLQHPWWPGRYSVCNIGAISGRYNFSRTHCHWTVNIQAFWQLLT